MAVWLCVICIEQLLTHHQDKVSRVQCCATFSRKSNSCKIISEEGSSVQFTSSKLFIQTLIKLEQLNIVQIGPRDFANYKVGTEITFKLTGRSRYNYYLLPNLVLIKLLVNFSFDL